MKKRTILVLFSIIALTLLFAQAKFAFITAKSDDKDKMLPGIDPSKVTGTIVTAGSSTVYPLSEAIASMFKKDGFTGLITIDSIGSGAGFDRFCKTGETDISNASVQIKQSQIDAARAIGRNPIEFRVGTDALAVVVSKKNTFIANATVQELAKIFSTAEKWSDVNPKWPAQPIKRFIPGTDSGTFSYFVEHVFNKKADPLLAAKNLQLSEDDNVLVRGIENDPYAIGFFGFAYYTENQKSLKALSIEGVAPGQTTVDNGTYPLARPLFLYSDAKIMNEKPQVAAFILYYLTYVNDVIKKVGYFPAPASALKQAKQNWLDAVKGRY
ncbi:MAG TPA: PstS family phosphate ABC transporter substrate-binding protein [Spirochaetia bacterium]|nr:PstS family phosphate ABC transporter substrate-binding protein [Spirochaetales bacterium]HOT59010.1 PstS family phosphate ABC transporter substrate-binding protein [Spirochaetales bacterium]HQK35084.1 PstS family phosphate ABC transporter substrate-binding protein [Spirochaetales bacterium]HRS66381.1 PstS family phosphate ABC transporter substrate-binding protein [Spirochaetia bacterium]